MTTGTHATLRRYQFGLRAFLLFVLVAGPLTAVAAKWYSDRGKPLEVQPTTGQILHADGSPLVGATVSLQGTGARSYSASGFTDGNGTFSLSTFEENDGAVEGVYIVIVADANGQQLLSANATIRRGKNVIRFIVR